MMIAWTATAALAVLVSALLALHHWLPVKYKQKLRRIGWRPIAAVSGGLLWVLFLYVDLSRKYAAWPAVSVISGCMFALALTYVYLSVRYKDKPINQATVLFLCALTALVIDERTVRFLRLPDCLVALYDLTYALKWEILALIASGFITGIYWFTELKDKDRISTTYFTRVATSILAAIVCLIFAVLSAGLAVVFQNYEVMLFMVHFVFILLVSMSFMMADKAIWKGIITTKEDGAPPTAAEKLEFKKRVDLKILAMLTYYLADLPVFLALLVLGVYAALHWSEHRFVAPIYRGLLYYHHKPLGSIDVWMTHEYFLVGAIAFQFLLSTTIYLILAWGAVKVEGVTIELPPSA